MAIVRNILLLALVWFPLFAEEPFDDEEDNDSTTIIVPLATGVKLLPLYLVHFKNDSRSYSNDYVMQLENVLRFDLENNGVTKVVESSSVLDREARNGNYFGKEWKSHVNYVIDVVVKEGSVEPSIASVKEAWMKASPSIAITGNIINDRREMHLIADMIQQALFGSEGIARSKLLYTVRQKVMGEEGWSCDVWECDYDGGNSRRVIADEGYIVTPQYTPPSPGKHPGSFVYVTYKLGQPKIYFAPLKGGTPQRFSYLKGNQLMPTLSKKRDKIAFISDVTGNPDLFIQDFDSEKGAVGKPRQIFTSHLATQGTPTFSPDGEQIAFVSNKDGTPRIYRLAIPGEGEKLKNVAAQLVTKYRRGCTAPAWSPDGKKIAYCARVDGVRQIFVYDLMTKKELQLTTGRENAENPTWAPNSLHIAYNAGIDGVSELYITNLNNPKAVKISSGEGEKRFPHWEPRG